ncbi:MAG: hypothetical protein ACI8Y7_000448 [Candidatus Woesearchaeota archaeon]|jgi:hypothetical protein
MELKKLGVIQIILAAIIIVAELESHHVFRSFSFRDIFLIFNPMILVSILMIIVGIKFIRSNKAINFHLEQLFSTIGLTKLPQKKVGFILFLAALLLFFIPISQAGLFTNFSFYRLGPLFFDDAKIPFTALCTFLIILGTYIIAKSK